jgi:hypothetical protein
MADVINDAQTFEGALFGEPFFEVPLATAVSVFRRWTTRLPRSFPRWKGVPSASRSLVYESSSTPKTDDRWLPVRTHQEASPAGVEPLGAPLPFRLSA